MTIPQDTRERVIQLLEHFQLHIKNKYRVLLCYDLSDDNIFQYNADMVIGK